MKKLLIYGFGISVLVLTVLYAPFESTTKNQPKNDICLSDEMIPIAIPTVLTTPDYKGETFSFTHELNFDGVSGVLYSEMDANGNFYYLAHSESLEAYFNIIPDRLLFDQFYESENELQAGGGIHSACISSCNTISKGQGRGACKVQCWADSIERLVDDFVALSKSHK